VITVVILILLFGQPNIPPVITACRTNEWQLVKGVIWDSKNCKVQWQVIYNFKDKNYIDKIGFQARKTNEYPLINTYILRRQK
jgi:hypothetical protein